MARSIRQWRVAFIMIFVVLPVTDAFAKIEVDTLAVQKNLGKGSWSMQFGLLEDLVLTSFQGGIISAKYHTSDGKAWRFGFSMFGSLSDVEQTGGSGSTPSNSDSNGQTLTVNAQYLNYPSRNKTVVFLYGFGPLFRLSRSTSSFDGSSVTSKNVYTRFAAGVSGTWGVEWFFKPGISMLAEYGMSVTYDRSKSTRRTETGNPFGSGNVQLSESESKSTSFRVDPSFVKFGLSFYF